MDRIPPTQPRSSSDPVSDAARPIANRGSPSDRQLHAVSPGRNKKRAQPQPVSPLLLTDEVSSGVEVDSFRTALEPGDPRVVAHRAKAISKFLNTGDTRAVTGAYVDACLGELAEPRPPRWSDRLVRDLTESFALFWAFAFSASVLATSILGFISAGTGFAPAGDAFYYAIGLSGFSLLGVGLFAGWLPGRREPLPNRPPPNVSTQITVAVREGRRLWGDLTAAVRAKNRYGDVLITHATTEQRHKLAQITLTSETSKVEQHIERSMAENEAVIAQHRKRKIYHDTEARHAEFEARVDQAAAARVGQVEARVKQRAREKLAKQAQTVSDLAAQANAEKERADNLTAQIRAYEAQESAVTRRRAEEIAEAEHARDLAKINASVVTMKTTASQPPPPLSQKEQREAEIAAAEHKKKLEGIRTATQKERHDQRVDRARLQRRLDGAKDPDSARRTRVQREQQREQQRIEEELGHIVTASERLAYAQRSFATYLARVADEFGRESDDYQEAEGLVERKMMELREREERRNSQAATSPFMLPAMAAPSHTAKDGANS